MNFIWNTSARLLMAAGALTWMSEPSSAQQVFNSDVVVKGSLCVGIDCPSPIGFGFDTVVLQENNLRLFFIDTSNTASFPQNDWRIVINDTSNGGGNHFSIEDVTGSRVPFRIDAGAPANSLRIDSAGDVGIGEDNPVLELHVTDGDSPTLRLEQDGSAGFTAQTWDVAGNEANFFVRDVTNGSKLPFKIKPDAPSNSLFVAADGDIGLGTDGPDGPLHIRDNSAYITLDDANDNDQWYITHGAGNSGKLEFTSVLDGGAPTLALVVEPSGNVGFGTTTPDGPLHIADNSSYITLEDTDNNDIWYITHQAGDNGDFEFTSVLNGSLTNLAFSVQPDGDLTIDGALTQNSDKHAKMAIEPIDPAEVLARVATLEVSEWTYRDDPEAARHMGPMAQDFHALFGLGESETGISSLDSAGVALAAIQALAEENEQQRELNSTLNEMVAKLTARIEKLENRTD